MTKNFTVIGLKFLRSLQMVHSHDRIETEDWPNKTLEFKRVDVRAF